MSDTATALASFRAENDVRVVSEDDAMFRWDETAHQEQQAQAAWTTDVHHFNKVYISALALVKMAAHARRGGSIEVMGLMQGKVMGRAMVVMDAFALPVEGTETRVNAQAEGYEYMVEYVTQGREAGRMEHVVGWYHSHPGYGCWLSGIDVATQVLNQKHLEPFIAVVVDPNRTMAAGKVELGAFRAYPEEYVAPNETGGEEAAAIPLEKMADFGVHCKRYYALDVGYFVSRADEQLLNKLWTRYWVDTLAQSPLFSNRGFSERLVKDVSSKVRRAAQPAMAREDLGVRVTTSEMGKLAQAAEQAGADAAQGRLAEALKRRLVGGG